jgi:glucose/arabinose dehydrogenase
MKRFALLFGLFMALMSSAAAQQRGRGGRLTVGVAPVPLPSAVVVLTKALSHPWGMTWLPNGDLLVTERPGRLRIVRNGVLDPTPISGLPPMHVRGLAGLLDVALHPKFATNKLVYFSYVKDGEKGAATAVFRGTLDGMALTDVRDVFVSESWMKGNDTADGRFGSRLLFLKDGTLLITVGDRDRADGGQNPKDDFGKVIRVNDDGSVPKDNPFAGRAGYLPEIYTFGQRNQQGLAYNPVNGELWASEQGPNGGDEINVIKAGKNYGWPIVSLGRNYDGTIVGEGFTKAGLEEPMVFWVPAIAISGLSVYNGDAFPAWKGHAFVGAMRNNTGQHVQRVWFNSKAEPIGREIFLAELKQRIREVKPGPDGFLYALTDETFGAVLKIEPLK